MKSILTLTNDEILLEMSDILGKKYTKAPGREKIGFLTDNPADYVQHGVVNEKELIRLYNESEKLNDLAVTLAINSLRNRKKDLFSLIKLTEKNENILDYGCGTGTHGIACLESGASVLFFDVSNFMLDIVQKRCDSRNFSDYHITDKIDKKNYESFFDKIFCTDVIEHVVDPEKVLNDFVFYLKIGGILHIHVSMHASFERGHLPCALEIWTTKCHKILKDKFIKKSENNYQLIKK